MAFFVAKILRKDPYKILEEWTPAQLYVAYGVYANQKAQENYHIWEQQPLSTRNKVDKPDEYAIYFRESIDDGERSNN